MSDYNPEFPERINGGSVKADSVGRAYDTAGGVIEVELADQGIMVRLDGSYVAFTPEDLLWQINNNGEPEHEPDQAYAQHLRDSYQARWPR